jgi:hypothetical protein
MVKNDSPRTRLSLESRFCIDLRRLGKVVSGVFLVDDTAKLSFNFRRHCGTVGADYTGYLFFNPSILVDDEF